MNERDQLGDLDVDGRIIDPLELILKKRVWGFELDSTGPEKGPVEGSCEYGNELRAP